jgi:hypothetical protein
MGTRRQQTGDGRQIMAAGSSGENIITLLCNTSAEQE